MKKTLANPPSGSPVLHVPAFSSTPPPRCRASLGSAAHEKCGALATVHRPSPRWIDDAYFCDDHKSETDVSIAGDLIIRRARVECWVLLAGVDMQVPICHVEAVARLDAAVRQAGGLLDVTRVTSTIGRYAAYTGAVGVQPSKGEPG